jgi:anti-sigma regulatory factor (Ser/Thr protein kinase)
MPKAKPKGGATKPRQFRLTDAEIATIDLIAAHAASQLGFTPTRTDVLRLAVRELAERRLKLK